MRSRAACARLILTSRAWKAANGAYVRNATRPHTRTRATAGFIKNTRPYFLRRVVAERASLGSRDYRFHTRAYRHTHTYARRARRGKSGETHSPAMIRVRVRVYMCAHVIDGTDVYTVLGRALCVEAALQPAFDDMINGAERKCKLLRTFD